MLGCTYEVQILALDFIHHGVHFLKAHNARYNLASYHIRRYAVGKALVYHKISGISEHCGMKSRNIAHKIIKAFAGNLAGGVLVYAVKQLHNIGVVGYFKIGVRLLAEFFNLNIFAVVLADRHARVYYVRYLHLYFGYFFLKLVLFFLKRL